MIRSQDVSYAFLDVNTARLLCSRLPTWSSYSS